MSENVLRRLGKKIAFAISLVITLPLIVAAWIETKVSKSEMVFISLGQFLSLFPGAIGSYFRSAYYFLTLAQCSWEIHIGFGSFFSHRAASLGNNVSMGSYCVIGTVAIDEGVMIASHVSITSGKRQHFDDSGRISSVPRFENIAIGRRTWIGEGAIILASVGSNCIVSAGTVVTKETPSGQVLAGNPGRLIKEMNE